MLAYAWMHISEVRCVRKYVLWKIDS